MVTCSAKALDAIHHIITKSAISTRLTLALNDLLFALYAGESRDAGTTEQTVAGVLAEPAVLTRVGRASVQEDVTGQTGKVHWTDAAVAIDLVLTKT